jgi:hypothetical protein
MPATRGALGFKLHTGWAAMVVVTGGPGGLKLLVRSRLELLPADGSIPRFIYHTAAEMGAAEAAALVKSAKLAAEKAARRGLGEALRALNPADVEIEAAGVLAGSMAVPDDLGAILRSHTLIHAAEGRLFQQAIFAACGGGGVEAITIRERDVWEKAASAYGLDEARFRDRVDALGKSAGPPWGADQKAATAAGLLALRGGRQSRD